MKDFLKDLKSTLDFFKVPSTVANSLMIYQTTVFVWFVYFATFIVVQGRINEEAVVCTADDHSDGFVKAVNRWCLSYGLFTGPNGTWYGQTVTHNKLNYYFWLPYILTVHAFVMHMAGWLRKTKEKGVMNCFLKHFISHGLIASEPCKDDKKEEIKFGVQIFQDKQEAKPPTAHVAKESCESPRNMDICEPDPALSEMVKVRSHSIQVVADILEQRVKGCCNVDWASSLIGCETLNLALQVMTFYFYNYLFHGEYLWLGLHSLNKLDSMFPNLAKCEFFHFGSSGTLLMKDALCVLSQNIFYRFILVVVWWSNIIFLISGVYILFFRIFEAMLYSQEWYLQMTNLIDHHAEMKLFKQFSYYDYLFFKYLKTNIGITNFHIVLQHFSAYPKSNKQIESSGDGFQSGNYRSDV